MDWRQLPGQWGHDQEIIRTEWDHALEEDSNSFEMHKMMIRVDQLLCTTKTMNSKVYTQKSEADAHG